LKKTLDYLESKRGRHTELISLYIPPGRQLSDVMNNLRSEYSTASNIKSRTTRKNVLDALERVMQRLRLFRETPPNGLVIFCGAIPQNGEGSEEIELYAIEPPEPTPIYYYRCDQRFHIEPLREILREKESYGLIVIDGNETAIATLSGRTLKIVDVITSGLSGKHRAGGQSARRFERLREQEVNNYYKRIGEHANKALLQIPNLKGIIIGGPGPTKEDFHKGGYLHYELNSRVLGIVDTAYGGEEGIDELVEKATEVFKEVRYVEEKKLMQSFLNELGHDTGLVTYGEDEVRVALNKGVVRILLISEEFEESRVFLECPNCGYRNEFTVKGGPNRVRQEFSGKQCPECSTILKISNVEDVIDELARLASQSGAEVELISTQTEEGIMLKNFGGIAAVLRYRQTS
jgi:peptide chain release factor subunit 1